MNVVETAEKRPAWEASPRRESVQNNGTHEYEQRVERAVPLIQHLLVVLPRRFGIDSPNARVVGHLGAKGIFLLSASVDEIANYE